MSSYLIISGVIGKKMLRFKRIPNFKFIFQSAAVDSMYRWIFCLFCFRNSLLRWKNGEFALKRLENCTYFESFCEIAQILLKQGKITADRSKVARRSSEVPQRRQKSFSKQNKKFVITRERRKVEELQRSFANCLRSSIGIFHGNLNHVKS